MKKALALILAFVLVIGASVAGTMAYLMDNDTVTNTFTVGKVKAELYETENGTEYGNKVDGNSYQLIPGKVYFKNPTVEVSSDSEDCYLFVKEEKNDASGWLTYTSAMTAANGWTQGTGENGNGIPENVWYRIVTKTERPKHWHLIQGDQVTINSALGNDRMPSTDADRPTLTYTAYAIQKAGFETNIKGAWEEVSKAVPANP